MRRSSLPAFVAGAVVAVVTIGLILSPTTKATPDARHIGTQFHTSYGPGCYYLYGEYTPPNGGAAITPVIKVYYREAGTTDVFEETTAWVSNVTKTWEKNLVVNYGTAGIEYYTKAFWTFDTPPSVQTVTSDTESIDEWPDDHWEGDDTKCGFFGYEYGNAWNSSIYWQDIGGTIYASGWSFQENNTVLVQVRETYGSYSAASANPNTDDNGYWCTALTYSGSSTYLYCRVGVAINGVMTWGRESKIEKGIPGGGY